MAISEGLRSVQTSATASNARADRSLVVEASLSPPRPWWAPAFRGGIRPLLLASDILACMVAGALSPSRPSLALYFGIVLVAFLYGVDLYRSRLRLSLLDDLPRLIQAWLMTVGTHGSRSADPPRRIRRDSTSSGSGRRPGDSPPAELSIGASSAPERVWVSHATVIVGADRTGEAIVHQLNMNPQCGLKPLGFLDNDAPT